MTVARSQQISLDHTPYYHCTTRCVRRAFLCGVDSHTGKNFDHRKQWMEDRLIELSKVFAIDLLAYAIMSNHYHVVVQINTNAACTWSDAAVVRRWTSIFKKPDTITASHVTLWRGRLCSLSWYMRCLNEPLARIANREDDCSGRFWEGRFKSQALLDEAALLRCMAYVDLNPVRAGNATTPEASQHTSVKARIYGTTNHLLPFVDEASHNSNSVPINKKNYLQLVDWTGRQLRSGKPGRIPNRLAPIMLRLSTDGEYWLSEMKYYGKWYYRAVGSMSTLERYCSHLGQQWLKGQVRMAKPQPI